MRGLQLLLVFLPVSLLASLAGISGIIIFAASALAIIPLAKLLGEATEVLADRSGPRIGGLLNATFGNAAELIIILCHSRRPDSACTGLTHRLNSGKPSSGARLCHALWRTQEWQADV